MLERRGGILLPKDKKYYNIAKSLIKVTKNFIDDSNKTIKLFEEYNDYIVIPRFYPIKEDILDNTTEGKEIDICLKKGFEPRPRQKKIIEIFSKRNKGIIQMEPGTGKTVTAIAIVSSIKRKTLIIAHKDMLLEQWKKEFLNFTNLTEDNIGRLTTSNYKDILINKDIIISTPHVFMNLLKENNEEKKDFINHLELANIGILIVDECHANIGPEQFTKCSLFVPAKRVFGLSATPRRTDGLDDVLSYHLGEVFYIPPEEGELIKPAVNMVYLDFDVFRKNMYFFFNNKFMISRYYNKIGESEKYREILKKIILKEYEKGRNILVLGKNIKPLLDLASHCGLPKEVVGVFSSGAVRMKKHSDRVEMISDTKDLEESFKTKRVVFSTYSICRDGNNRIDLDCLIMQTPTSNPEQAIGRVLRKTGSKKEVTVYDFVDTGVKVGTRKVYELMAEKRKKMYKEFGWNLNIYREKEKEK